MGEVVAHREFERLALLGVVPAASGQASWASSRRCASAAASVSVSGVRAGPAGAPPGVNAAVAGAFAATAGGGRRPARAPWGTDPPDGCLPGGPPARFVSCFEESLRG